MPKVHLLLSSAPIEKGSTQSAMCGTEIQNCARVYSFGTDLRSNIFAGAKGLCRKCMDAYWKADVRGKHHLFGIVHADEAISGGEKVGGLYA